MRIQVADLRPNPYRNLSHYPINAEKVDALVRSIKDTEFWDNLLVRKAPDGDGFEMAYGHHRYVALKKARVIEIDVPCRKLDDTQMAQIMARENMEEWSHSASIEQEAVRSIIEAYGRGEINMPQPTRDTSNATLRHAPHFQPGVDGNSSSNDRPYTTDSLAVFLGWKDYKVKAALDALSLIEQSIAKPETFTDLTTRQALSVTQEASRVLNATKDPSRAKAVASGLAAGFRQATGARKATGDKRRGRASDDVTIHTARRQADRMAGTRIVKATAKTLPNFDKFIDGIAEACGWFFENKRHQWDSVVKWRAEMPAASKRKLIASLQRLMREANRYIEKLEG